ncbi:MAG: glycosyltransferase family 39 protein [Candidatus Promineofilum sp.]|nr:glycosyltransferase family 39 protein [Promineifilum sp.]
MRRTEYTLLGLLLLAYLGLGVLFAARTAAWQAPDEPAHYNYVRQLLDGRWPVIEPGDWDQAYLSEVVGAEFDPAYPVDGLTYEDWQPPLYYLLQVPLYQLSGGSLTAMRLLSVALGGGVVALAYLIGRVVFNGRVPLALAVAAFVAFLPQHLAILASVNNDSLAELIIAAILALLVLPWPDRPAAGRLLGLGLLLGLGFLTKGTAYLMAPVAGIFLLARYWPRPDRLVAGKAQELLKTSRPLVRALLLVFVPALLLGLLWWGRNLAVYGGLDAIGKEAHDAVVVGQPRTAEWIAQYGLGDTAGRFLRTTFTSFWGQFGWMAAPLPGWMVALLGLITLAAVAGLLLAAMNARRRPTVDGRRTTVDGQGSMVGGQKFLHVLVLGLTFLLTLALHIFYNLTFVQHQGRYLFPALIPIAVGFTAGLAYWLRPLGQRWTWAAYLLPLGVALLLAGMALFALWRIVPGLMPG